MYPRRNHGFAIVSAIFILVVLAGLGAAIATVSTTQHIGSALDIMGSRAYFSARSGIEWGLDRAINASSCAASTNIGTINSVYVTVQCSSIASGNAVEAGLGTIYSISAIACNVSDGATPPGCLSSSASGQNYVERKLTVMVEQ